MKKKIIVFISILVICLSMFPIQTFAATEEVSEVQTPNGFTYYCPKGYENVSLLRDGTAKYLFFTKDNNKIVQSGYNFYAVEEDGTTETTMYYISVGQGKQYWTAINILSSEETVKTSATLKQVGAKFNFMGTKEFLFGNGKNENLEDYYEKYYKIVNNEYQSSDDDYTYYNRPKRLDTEYMLFKRASDTKYTLIFRPTTGTSGNAEIDNSKFIFKNDEMFVEADSTYWIQFNSIEEAYDYLFSDISVAQKQQIKLIKETQPTNSVGLTPNYILYKLQKMTTETEIINNTIPVYNSKTQTATPANPASYSEWHYNKFGYYPQPDIENSEFMKGQYYVIAKQPVIRTYNGVSIDTGERVYYNKVETCTSVNLGTEDGVYTYVVISTNTDNTEHIALPQGTFWEVLKGAIGEFLNSFIDNNTLSKMINIIKTEYSDVNVGANRNNYPLLEEIPTFGIYGKVAPLPMLYNETETLNRYYFSNAHDACKFVLYGTAGAMYDHKEEGMTHFGYGYREIMYNNYDLDGYPQNNIPTDQYPLGKTYITLRWHDNNVAEREYLRISFNYFPMASTLGTDDILRIPQKLEPEFYVAYETEENKSSFDYTDFSIYEKTDKYGEKLIHKFYIYHPKIESALISNSWDIVDSLHSIYKNKDKGTNENGFPIVGSGSIYEDDPIIETLTNPNGDKAIYDKQNNKYIHDGKEYIWDEEKQQYINPETDEAFNPDEWTSSMDDWRNELTNYATSIENITIVIEDFTDIINTSTKEVAELTSFLNKAFNSLPGIFRIIFNFVIISLIIMRITRRK